MKFFLSMFIIAIVSALVLTASAQCDDQATLNCVFDFIFSVMF